MKMLESGRITDGSGMSLDSLSNVIESVGEKIYEQLDPNSQSKNLQAAQEWADKHGLDRTGDSQHLVCRLTAYDRLLKISLYGLYRIDKPGLPGISNPDDISARLIHAREQIDDAAFEPYVLDDIADLVEPSTLEPLLDNRHQLLNSEKPTADIANLFEQLIPQKARRKLGQFRTPERVAEIMANWSVRQGDDYVLDPGMGAGVLTSKSYDVKKKKRGREGIEDMWGIDVSELAVVMTSTALKLVNGKGIPHLFTGNFMKSVAEEGKSFDGVSRACRLPKVDVIVSNPPYSRHHELSRGEKAWINKIAENDSTLRISKRAPMYLYFYVHALQFLKPGGRLSFITPSEFLETKYGEQLKKFLLDNYYIHGLIIADSDLSVFNNARTTACISFLEKMGGNKSGDVSTTFLKLTRWPGMEDLQRAIDGEVTGDISYGIINQVPQLELDPETKWTNYFSLDPYLSFPDLKPFNEIAEIKRGIATGKNEYFCLSQEDINKWGINPKYLSRVVRRIDPNSNLELDGDWWREQENPHWLLYHLENEIENDEAVKAYIKYGQNTGVNDGYITSNRDPWYRVERRDPPSIIATYMSKNGFRFIQNMAEVRTLNNLHNIYLNPCYSEDQIRALMVYLNSGLFNKILTQNGRTYSGGMNKIEPNELKNAPVLDPNELTATQIVELGRLYEDLYHACRTPNEDTHEMIRKIDDYLRSIIAVERT